MFNCMYEQILSCSDKEIANHITPLPGVIDQFNTLAKMQDKVMCGLVTGNVEGIGTYLAHFFMLYLSKKS